jgi:5-methylthioadenosine/S-adenosylhomocysteine deaminase
MSKVDYLLTNAIVLTMDEGYRQYENGAVAVQGDHILAVGPEKEILEQFEAEHTIDCEQKVLMPGLINAHTHVPMTLLRGLADDLRLDVWLMGYMMPVEREFVSPEFVTLGTKLACAEMIRSGVTCFADMYYFEESVAKATAEAGMRAVCSQSVMKFPTPDAASYEESLALARNFIQTWKNHPLIVPSVAPHAVYTCTPEILQATADLAIEFDVPLHTHIAETAAEVENLRNDQGMPVVPYMKKQGIFEAKVLAAHCVHVDEGEMRSLHHSKAGVAHNPSSNLKLASGVAPIKRMLELGLNVGIGTDGAASNNDLDMFEETRLAAFLAKGMSGDPTALPARLALAMATRIGAQALHIGQITGSISPGKRADLILFDLARVHNSPQFRRDNNGTYAQIVYAGKATDVTDVMINGQWVMRSQQLLTLNEQELRQAAQEYAKKIDIFLMQREKYILSKLIAIGGATEEESFEIQAKAPLSDPEKAITTIHGSDFEIIRSRHYQEYDTYFSFDETEQGYLRYREDHFVGERGDITHVRSRLTLIGPTQEREFPQGVLLSRSRYLAPATQPLRFYREYFKPNYELEIEKERRRFLVRYKNIEFFINVDRVYKPDMGYFLEVKSRTWSRKDAESKSALCAELIRLLGGSPTTALPDDYIKMVEVK